MRRDAPSDVYIHEPNVNKNIFIVNFVAFFEFYNNENDKTKNNYRIHSEFRYPNFNQIQHRISWVIAVRNL